MTDRSVTLRLAVANAERAIRDLKSFGTQGDQALKRIETASAPAAKGLQSVNTAALALGRSAPQLGAALAVIGAGAGAAAVAAVAALGAGLAIGVKNSEAAERSFLRLDGVLRATGGAAGLTAGEIATLADELERSTLATGEAVVDAAAVLATFRSISGDTFTDTLRLAQDLAAVFGGNLSSQATQLGKALEDPVQGLTALRRVGISFTQDQRDVIEALVETGQTAEAQRKILETLERQVGGAGAAEAGGLTGAWSALRAELGDVLQDFAELTGAAGALEGTLRGVVGVIGDLRGSFAADPLGDLQRIRSEIAALQSGPSSAGLRDTATRTGLSGEALATAARQDTTARIAALLEEETAIKRTIIAEQGRVVAARVTGAALAKQAEAERLAAQERAAAEKAAEAAAAAAARAAAAAESAAQRRAEAIQKTIGGLQAEVDQQQRLRQALGESERAHRDVSKAIEVENELRAVGLDLTSAQGQELARLVTLRQDEAEALERLQNAQRFLAEQESDRIRKLEDRGFDPAQQARDMGGRADEARRAAEREQQAAVTKQVRPLRPSAAVRIAAAIG